MKNYLLLCGVVTLVGASAASAQPTLSRKNLAKNASFTVTSTLLPNGGSKEVQTFRVEVSGDSARLDYADRFLGTVRYLANPKGIFFYIPANKTAQRQTTTLEQALQLAFGQALSQIRGARPVGTATISGQPTDIYKSGATTVYVGKNPGFRLPVKVELTNEGGRRVLLASDITLNTPIPAARFALPPGTQLIEKQGGTGTGVSGGLPGVK